MFFRYKLVQLAIIQEYIKISIYFFSGQNELKQVSYMYIITLCLFGGIVFLQFLKNSQDVLLQQISTTLSTVGTTSCSYCRQCRQLYLLQTVQIVLPIDSVDSCTYCRQCRQLYLLQTVQTGVPTVDSVEKHIAIACEKSDFNQSAMV